MKELSIEEKAKAYDDALEKASKLRVQNPFDNVSQMMEYVFPNLKEDEDKDEKIRKELIEHCKEQADIYKTLQTAKEYGEIQSWIAWLEKQEEIKIPKWIFDFLEECRPYIGCALGYDERRDIEGKVVAVQKWLEKQGEHKQLKKIEQEYHCTGVREPKEATGVLKQLINEQKFDWSEDDNKLLTYILVTMKSYITRDKVAEVENWLKSLKDRVKPLSTQEWSEEDKVKINRIVAFLENLNLEYLNVVGNDILLKDIEWLKSLKERYTWKPSKEQM